MTGLPIRLNLANKKIVVIGGGNSAAIKLKGLQDYISQVTVVAKDVTREVRSLASNIIIDSYNKEYIEGAFLVYICTDHVEVNAQVAIDADDLGILYNRTDVPSLSSFSASAQVESEEYQIGVNTKVRAPYKASRLAKRLSAFVKQIEQYDALDDKGHVYLVGFGPGDRELISVRGEHLLYHATVILYDDLLDASCLDSYPGTKVFVGKRRGNHHKTQDETNEMLLRLAQEGHRVVRLKGGDPLIFGRGGEEKAYLEAHGISVSIIPGITSAIAAASLSGIPLTHRGVSSSVTFGTAHGQDSFKVLNADTSVYYMGAKHIREIAAKFRQEGYPSDYPVAVVHKVSHPDQSVLKTNLQELEDGMHEIKSPVISIFGKSAGL